MNMIHKAGLLAASLALTTACGTLSVDEEKNLGRQVQRQVAKEVTLMRERVTVNYVRKLGDRLAAAGRPTPFEFRFYVVESEDLNAFAIPGGAIYVNTGLIQAVANASELAGVIAHEIGHVTARHTAQIANRQRNTGFVAQAATIVFAVLTGNYYAANAGELAARVAATAYVSQFSREFEREADELAVETMVRAGYDPNGLVTMFETLKKEAGGGLKGPQFLSSHPAPTDRIERTKREIASVNAAAALKTDDGGQLEIIQKRLDLIVGTDAGTDLLDDEDDPDVEE